MESYLLFESQDPLESAQVPRHYELAAALKKAGNQVTLFLVQNGVLGARRALRSEAVLGLVAAGVEVLADDFSLRERGVNASRLSPGVKVATIDDALDQFAAGRKALWL
jgi:predicted peroxiredoxin